MAEAPRWRRLWPAAAKGVALFAVALVVFLYAFPATPPNHGKAGIVAGAGGAVILPQQDIERPAPHLVGSARGGSAMDGFIAAPIDSGGDRDHRRAYAYAAAHAAHCGTMLGDVSQPKAHLQAYVGSGCVD